MEERDQMQVWRDNKTTLTEIRDDSTHVVVSLLEDRIARLEWILQHYDKPIPALADCK